MNIPFNALLATTYLILGIAIYGIFHGCHPKNVKTDKILLNFIETKLSSIPGIEGLFLASIYAAGISTLTALYSALTSVFIEDIWIIIIKKITKVERLNKNINLNLIKFLRKFSNYIIMCIFSLCFCFNSFNFSLFNYKF